MFLRAAKEWKAYGLIQDTVTHAIYNQPPETLLQKSMKVCFIVYTVTSYLKRIICVCYKNIKTYSFHSSAKN